MSWFNKNKDSVDEKQAKNDNNLDIRFGNINDDQVHSIVRRALKIKDEVAPNARFNAVRFKGLPAKKQQMLRDGKDE